MDTQTYNVLHDKGENCEENAADKARPQNKWTPIALGHQHRAKGSDEQINAASAKVRPLRIVKGEASFFENRHRVVENLAERKYYVEYESQTNKHAHSPH